MVIQNVALIGANGRLGPAVLKALQDSKTLKVTVLTRAGSKSKYDKDIRVVALPEDFPNGDLASVLQGLDALVVTMPATAVKEQIALADACVKAGVRRFIPADYGSVDSSDERCLELVPLYRDKKIVREHCQKLATEHPDFSWTSLVCGHFFDWGLKSGLLGYDILEGKATIFDDGEVKWSSTTLSTIGRAVAKTLDKENQTKNRMLYIHDFCVNQYDVLEALMRAGGKNFTASFVKSDDFIKEMQKRIAAGDHEAKEHLVTVLGVTRANWEYKPDLANDLLELGPKDLDATIKEVYLSKMNS